MNYKIVITIIFLFLNFFRCSDTQAITSYCCCNQTLTQCLSGDGQGCCSHPEHPLINTCITDCGSLATGDLGVNSNICGNVCTNGSCTPNLGNCKTAVPYCCCNETLTQCLGGDGKGCCSRPEHPLISTCQFNNNNINNYLCQGVSMTGDLNINPTCGNKVIGCSTEAKPPKVKKSDTKKMD